MKRMVLLILSMLILSCDFGSLTPGSKPAGPAPTIKTLAETLVDEYISRLATLDLSRSLNRATISNTLSNSDIATLKSAILTKIVNDGLMSSKKADSILGSLMKGVTTGVVALGAGSLANDTRAGSILISVAIKSSVESLVARPESVSSTISMADMVGAVVKSGVTSLSTVSSSDVVSLQKAIVQSVQDVVSATRGTTITAADAVKIAVSSTVLGASASPAVKSANLMQAAFSGAMTALKSENPASTTLMADLQAVVVDSIKTVSASNSSEFTSSVAQNILEQAAVGLTSSGTPETSGSLSSIQSALQSAASEASSSLSMTVDASAAVATAAEVTPIAVLAVVGHTTPLLLPYVAQGYQLQLVATGSTLQGTNLEVTCPTATVVAGSDDTWSATLASGASYVFTLKVSNLTGVKSSYISVTVEIAPRPGETAPNAVLTASLNGEPITTTLAYQSGGYLVVLSAAGSTAENVNVSLSSDSATIPSGSQSPWTVALSSGKTTFTLTVKNSDGAMFATATKTIQIDNPPVTSVTGVSLAPTSLSLKVDQVGTLVATVAPATATDSSVVWTSSKTSVATVNSTGVVTAKAAGTATISVTTTDGSFTASCAITVEPKTVFVPVTGITFGQATMALKPQGTTSTLSATVAPDNATNKTYSWTTSNPLVATVTASGVVTPKAKGTATIKATTADGGKVASCEVTVWEPVSAIALDKTDVTITLGDNAVQLTATVSPDNASNKTITWTTSNTAVATVSANGLISGKGVGSASITATTVDGSLATVATFKVLPNGNSSGTITIEKPGEPLAQITGLAKVAKTAGTITYTASFSDTAIAYEWYLNGTPLTEAGKVLELDSALLPVGKHLLTVFVNKAYSGSFDLWVTE